MHIFHKYITYSLTWIDLKDECEFGFNLKVRSDWPIVSNTLPISACKCLIDTLHSGPETLANNFVELQILRIPDIPFIFRFQHNLVYIWIFKIYFIYLYLYILISITFFHNAWLSWVNGKVSRVRFVHLFRPSRWDLSQVLTFIFFANGINYNIIRFCRLLVVVSRSTLLWLLLLLFNFGYSAHLYIVLEHCSVGIALELSKLNSWTF